MLKISSIEFRDKPLFLAPMEDVTDPSFRYMCKQLGADMMYTEFVSSDGLIRDVKKSVKKLDIFDYERPIGIQIYGHHIDAMVEAAIRVAEAQPDIIDINFGCPVKKVANRGAGSGMMKDVPKLIEMTAAIVKAVKIPVTVKTRLGWDENTKNIVEIAERLNDVGIQALTIHGRTRCQLYTGKADWTLIGEVKNNPRIKIPIIGNGDVKTPETAKLMFDRYGVDAIMIGRGSIGKPWIFKEIRHYLDTNELLASPTINEIVEMSKTQFLRSLSWKHGDRGIFEMRRHFALYFKGLPNFKETRMKLVTSLDIDEIFNILDYVKNTWGEIKYLEPDVLEMV